jgi:hypothetical protein
MNLATSIKLFPEITLEEMNNVKLMDRVETKFLLSLKDLPSIFQVLHNDYRVVNINDNVIPDYKTVYFDTDDYFFYHEHHRKRKDRYKVRFRNYVESELTFLEVKHKKNGRVDKKRNRVENEVFLISDDEPLLIDAGLGAFNLKEKLTNYYSRITLVSKHSIERVTFDLNIKFEHEDNNESLDNLVIVELKQAKLSRVSPIYNALKKASIKPYTMSKYCIGLIKTAGKEAVKYNRFKKKLLKIKNITKE